MDGSKIRFLRKENNLTIEELAEITGFTASYISQIERNKIEPSLTALSKLSKALKVSLYYFLKENDEGSLIVRKENRITISSNDSQNKIFLTDITNMSGIKPKFYVYEMTIGSNEYSNKEFHTADSQKCIIVKNGVLTVEINDSEKILYEGDCIYLDSMITHRCYNPSSENTELLCIVSSDK